MKYLNKITAALLLSALAFSGLYAHKTHVDQETTKIYNQLELHEDKTGFINNKLADALQDLYDETISRDEFLLILDVVLTELDDLVKSIEIIKGNAVNDYYLLAQELKLLQYNYENIKLYIESIQQDILNPYQKNILKQTLYKKCLYPSVRIIVYAETLYFSIDENGNKVKEWVITRWSTGSGTIIKSDPDPETGEIKTYIISAGHLSDGIESDWSKLHHLEIDLFDFRGNFETVEASIVNNDMNYDLMMLQIDDKETIYPTGEIANEKEITQLDIFTDILNVGCGLGTRPYPAYGIITALYLENNTYKSWWQMSAPIIYGNSGGGVFTMDGKLIGVVSMGNLDRGIMQNHMALIVSPDMIYEWIYKHNLEYVLE